MRKQVRVLAKIQDKSKNKQNLASLHYLRTFYSFFLV